MSDLTKRAMLARILHELKELKHMANAANDKLNEIADALNTGFDALTATTTEIEGDMNELLALIGDAQVPAETLAKFEALQAKMAGLSTALETVANIVPETPNEPPVV